MQKRAEQAPGIKLGDEADIEMQPDICAKEETNHVRIDAHFEC